ncbi:MAG: PhoH family protein [Burkholderiaceae bacterium]
MKPRPIEFTAEPADNERLANLCGPVERNIRTIAESFDVRISRRGQRFRIEGEPAAAEQAREVLARFWQAATRPLSPDDIQLGLAERRPVAVDGDEGEDEGPILHTRRSDLRGRTPRQRDYLRNILSHDITFGVGPAGTGKTYLAVACAVDALERDAIKRIVLTRPAVEAGERLGFLPGDLAQKVDPYLRPLYDALYDLLGFERTAKMFEKQAIEIAPLAYMRGRTLNHSFIILDEAQNTTPEQMKMFLTRIGFGSRAVVTGDTTQVDLPRGQPSGLMQSVNILRGVRGIAFSTFDSADVMRHPLVARIVDAYEKHQREIDAAAEPPATS